MQIWMIRHAEAMSVWETGGSDFERPLTDAGRAEFGALCRRISDRQSPDLILHSPRRRALETATILQESFCLPTEILEMLPVLGDAPFLDDIMSATAHREERVVAVVGHQPSMSQLVRTMSGADVRFSPGTIAAIDFSNRSVTRDAGELLWSESP